jgi:hypothetical protein
VYKRDTDGITRMFNATTTDKKKEYWHFFAMLFCAIVIASTFGNSFGIGNSFAQERQLHTHQSSTLSQQPLCQGGICNTKTMQPNNVDPQLISSSQAFTNSKNLNLSRSFVSNKVVGPDRFRFVTSYWTLSDTSLGVDVGTSANNTFLAAGSLSPNPKVEVDTNEGPSTLAVALQYEGVANLAGITAALKLPPGFTAQFPLTSDNHRFDIALSSYRGHIYPDQGIVLYFSVNVLPTAKVQLPVLGPLALHFLRSDQRSTLDSLSDQSNFAKALFTNTIFFDPTTFHSNFDFTRNYYAQFRFIPFDFVSQVIPVILKITGKEVLDVVTLPPGKASPCIHYTSPCTSIKNISMQIFKIPAGVTTTVRLAVRNIGDVATVPGPIILVNPGLQSALGINGVNPSTITSPSIPQTLLSTIIPVGIVGPSIITPGPYYKSPLPANTSYEFDVSVFPTHYVAGTVMVLNLELLWKNIVGKERSQMNQVYFEIT